MTDLENHFNADILSYYGAIMDGVESDILNIIEDLVNPKVHDTLYVILTTGGGSAIARFHIMKQMSEAVDKIRKIDRKEFDQLKGSKYLWLRNQNKLNSDQTLDKELRLKIEDYSGI